MRLRLEADPEELASRGGALVRSLADALAPHDRHLAQALTKAASSAAPPRTLPDPVIQDLREQFVRRYEKQMAEMNRAIGRVLDRSVREVAKSAAGEA